MLRLLLLAIAGYLIWSLLRYAMAALRGPDEPRSDEPPYKPMARCARCGAHVPQDQLNAEGECTRCNG